MRELPPYPENDKRRNSIIQLARQYAENYLLFLAMEKEDYGESNKIASPHTKPWLFVNDPKKIRVDSEIMKANLKIAEEKLGKLSEKEKILFEKVYKHRLFMGTPLNEA